MRKQKYCIDEISSIVAPIAREFGIKKMTIFGSYARGEATEGSDIDFHLVDRGSLRGFFRLMGFESALEDSLHIPVDVIVSDSNFNDVYQNILREEIVIYDAN